MLFPEITDWRINLHNPEKSVYFKDYYPAAVANENGTLHMAIKLADAITVRSVASKRFDMEINGHWHRIEAMPNGVLAVRVIPDGVPSLEDLKIPTQYREILLGKSLAQRGGLIIFSGAGGSGKSTTAIATIIERLKLYGGYGLTYENPIEYRAQGFHGGGYLDQNSVSQDDMIDALTKSMRCLPVGGRALIFVGEILDSEIAHEVFRLMMNGHLVLTTSFGVGIIESIERICTLLDAENNKAAREILASNLRWVINQQLTPQHRVQMRALEITRAAEQLIAHGLLLNLKDEIARTEERLGRQS